MVTVPWKLPTRSCRRSVLTGSRNSAMPFKKYILALGSALADYRWDATVHEEGWMYLLNGIALLRAPVKTDLLQDLVGNFQGTEVAHQILQKISFNRVSQ